MLIKNNRYIKLREKINKKKNKKYLLGLKLFECKLYFMFKKNQFRNIYDMCKSENEITYDKRKLKLSLEDKKFIIKKIPEEVINDIIIKSGFDFDFFENKEEEIPTCRYLDLLSTVRILIDILEYNSYCDLENNDKLNEKIFNESKYIENQKSILKYNFDDVICFSERYYIKYNKLPKKIIYNDIKKGFEIFI